MKKNLKVLLAITIMIIMVGITLNVNAFSSTAKLASSSKLKAGDTVEVIFSLTNIDMGEGVNALSATLEYDKDVFETISDDENSQYYFEDYIQGQNRWSIGTYSSGNQMLTAIRNSGVKENTDVFKVTFKVKSSISVDSTIVKLKNIKISAGEETGDIDVADVSVTVSKETNTTPTTPTKEDTTPTTPTTQTTPSTSTKQNTPSTTKTTTSGEATGKLPQTGERTLVIAGSFTAIVAVAGLAFIKYRKINIK